MNIEEDNLVKQESAASGRESKAPIKSPTSLWKYLFLTILIVAPAFLLYECTKIVAGVPITATKDLMKILKDTFGSGDPVGRIDPMVKGETKEVSQITLWCTKFPKTDKWKDTSLFGDDVIELKVDFTAYYGVNVEDLLKGAWYDFDKLEWELNPLPLKLLSLHIRHQDIIEDKGSVSPSRTATAFNGIRYKLVPELEKDLKEDPRNKDYAERRISEIFKALNLNVRFKPEDQVQTIQRLN